MKSKFNISFNQIKTLPDILPFDYLRVFRLTNNYISHVGCAISHLGELQWLNLANNNITALDEK